MWANRFRRDQDGAALTEFLLILPILVFSVFSVVDMGMLMWKWNQASKATQAGARYAVTHAIVATGVNDFGNPEDTANVGRSCTNPDGSQAMSGGETPAALCPASDSTCTSGGCDGSFIPASVNSAAFTGIVEAVQQWLPTATADNVVVTYSTIGLGFIGRPGGSPVAVTVSLRCAAVDLIWLDAFLTAPAACEDMVGAPIPAYATTLIGEDLVDGWGF